MKVIFLITSGLTAFALIWTQPKAQAQDTTPPALASAASSDGMTIGLQFSEPMNPAGLDDHFIYEVEDALSPIGVFQASIQPGNRVVALSLTRAVAGPFVVTIQTDSLVDLAGNPLPLGARITGTLWTPGWTLADVGGPTPAGQLISWAPDAMIMTAGGDNIGGVSDQFTYLYAPHTNDFDVSVRVESLDYVGHRGSKAGLVIRTSLDPASAMYMLFAYPVEGDNFFLARVRPYAGEEMRDCIVPNRPIGAWPVWLRLKRSGTTFTGYTSTNGVHWEPFGPPQDAAQFPAVLLVGLGTTSHINGTATRAQYEHFGETHFYSNVVITLSQQPASVNVEEHNLATFAAAASVTGAPAGELQWQWQAETRPGSGEYTNIYFATHATYTTPSLPPSASGTGFRVVATVPGNPPVVSDAARITVVPDVSAPRVLSARGTPSLQHIEVRFSEPMRLGTEFVASVSGGLGVVDATLDPAGTMLVLALGGSQSPGQVYDLTLSGLADLSGHALDAGTLSVRTLVASTGFALREAYFDIDGTQLAALRDSPKFPHAPDRVDYVSQLEGFLLLNPRTPGNTFDRYGLRLSGFLRPPTNGAYHFYLSGDDQCEFWLSTDESPARRVRLCSEPEWNSARDWTGTTRRPGQENRSTALFPNGVPLVAGNRYYFEVLMKEGGGGDHVAVTWQPPGAALPPNGSPPISGAYLEALVDPTGVSLTVTQQPQDKVVLFDPQSGADPRLLWSQNLQLSDGDFTVITPNPFSGPWQYDGASGTWRADGQSEELGRPMTSRLRTPPLSVTRSGRVRLTFSHRYSFEFDGTRWDGGNLRISVNGGPYQLVPGSAFTQNGYDSVVALGSASEIRGETAFTVDSAGHGTGVFITSIADLGYFFAGDTVSIEFTYGGDTNTRGAVPNWEIDELALNEGNAGQPPVQFSVGATGVLPGYPEPPVLYLWERDCGGGFLPIVGANEAVLTVIPTVSDNGCRYRARAYVPGATALSAVATLQVQVRQPVLSIRREPPNLRITWEGPGTLQNANVLIGPWGNVSGVTNNTFIMRPLPAVRFYRVRVP